MSALRKTFVYAVLPAVIVGIAIFLNGCDEKTLRDIGGNPYGGLYGMVKDTDSAGINDVSVGLTPSDDADHFVDDPRKIMAKCSYFTVTGPAIGDYTPLGNGFYKFDRVDINMNTKYIVVWKDGFYPVLVESRIDKYTETMQTPIVMTRVE